MDKLYEAAKFYKENLEGKKYLLRAVKKNNKLELHIAFGAENFKHLLGLHKLEDLRISKLSSNNGYMEILNGRTTFQDIKRSKYFNQISDRLENFSEIKTILSSKELMVKSLHGEFNFIKADFMLTQKNDKYGYAHLFLKGTDFTMPVTFIIHHDNSYLRNNPNKWTVLFVEEIKKQ